MLELKTTSKFRREYKAMKKRGLDMSELEAVIDTLLAEKPLDRKYHDHDLHGQYEGYRECHVQPDWLLIYIIDKGQAVLVAARTGTHSDLF